MIRPASSAAPTADHEPTVLFRTDPHAEPADPAAIVEALVQVVLSAAGRRRERLVDQAQQGGEDAIDS